jgi:hypothetical protein
MSIETKLPTPDIEEFDKAFDAGIALKRLDETISSIKDEKDKKGMASLRDNFIESISSYSASIAAFEMTSKARINITDSKDRKCFQSEMEDSDARRRRNHQLLITNFNVLVRNFSQRNIDLSWTSVISNNLYERIKKSDEKSLAHIVDFDKNHEDREKIGEWAINCGKYLKIQEQIKKAA